ncbi:MAG TPA: isocitrate lyase/PEP mutase family protein, partial [Usitatibacter sp.]
SDRCVHASSLFDPMSARIADHLGIEVGLMGGSVASLAVLGAPDVMVLTLTELAEQTRRVARAGNLCVLVDADHGYGNALNVMRTVEELQAAGAAGCSIEDTLLPRAFGSPRGAELLSIEEGVGKMKAAVRARGDSGMAVFGRSSAHSIAGVDEAIRRFKAYEETGIDAVFIPGVKKREDLDAIAGELRLPIVAAGVGEKAADAQYLASRRARIYSTGHEPFAAAVQAMHDTMKAIRDGAGSKDLRNIASGELMAKLARSADYDAFTKDYLGG